MKRSYKERVNYEIKRRITRDSQKAFFYGAVDRMKYNSTPKEVEADKEFACDVISHTGFCQHVDCEHCLLERMFNEAMKDFALGIR